MAMLIRRHVGADSRDTALAIRLLGKPKFTRNDMTLTSTTDRGFTLIETMVAVLIAIIGVFSVASVIFVASVTTNNQGSDATRATVYAQDKMEKLLSLDFSTSPPDISSCDQAASSQPSSGSTSCNTTGISAAGWTQGLLAGGSTSPMQASCGSANAGYEDFLDANGNQITGSSCSTLSASPVYVRQWQITDLTPLSSGSHLKQITVAVYALTAQNPAGGIPIAVLTSILTGQN
jgi:Tfp pilus assembly protein PilV